MAFTICGICGEEGHTKRFHRRTASYYGPATLEPRPEDFEDRPQLRDNDTAAVRALNERLSALGRCPRCHLLLPCESCIPASAADLPLQKAVDPSE
jgi:hypothetical protein